MLLLLPLLLLSPLLLPLLLPLLQLLNKQSSIAWPADSPCHPALGRFQASPPARAAASSCRGRAAPGAVPELEVLLAATAC